MLERINSINDLKKLNIDELRVLASDIRECLIKKMSVCGGHFGPNLGTVEVEIALHYVFNSPIDKFVFDVSHQSYTHKILTGRKDAFTNQNQYNTVTGYTNPKESEHDMFTVGHTSTSIALALGLAKARDINKEKSNVIALIGDGSLSGGEALEGLNVAGELDSNLIIIVNDNQMSIVENHGGIYKSLKDLRESKGVSENNIFKTFGLDYCYIENGNDLSCVIETLSKVKNINHPIVVHINTLKGCGYEPSLKVKSDWHYTMPFDIKTGKELKPYIRDSYSNITGSILKSRIDKGDNILAITAALPFYLGFSEEDRIKYKDNFIDVGIAEEAAVALVSASAKGHVKSVFATAGTFLQRSYDQIYQDLCLDNNPATLLVCNASLYGGRDSTHLGISITSMLLNIPNLVVLAPTSNAEYINMLNWSLDQTKNSVAILVPAKGIVEDERVPYTDYSVVKNKVEVRGSKVAIFGINDFYQYAEDITHSLNNEGIYPTLINPICLSSLDTETLDTLKDYDLIVTIEGYILSGGYGEKISSYFGDSHVLVKNFGLRKEIIDKFKPEDVMANNNMTKEDIVSYILSKIKK